MNVTVAYDFGGCEDTWFIALIDSEGVELNEGDAFNVLVIKQ
jgi:hypothetical protein